MMKDYLNTLSYDEDYLNTLSLNITTMLKSYLNTLISYMLHKYDLVLYCNKNIYMRSSDQ